jgi:small conductance mechanosensitive channel
VDLTFGIGYGESIDHAKSVLQKIFKTDDRILQEPAPPFAEVSELGDSSVNFTVRLWVESANYWPVYFAMNEKVYNEFGKEKISIPFPQMDVHVINES